MKKFAARLLRRAFLPLVPKRFHLPLRYRLSVLDGSCENELRYLDCIADTGEIAIDVGANAGLFSYNLSKRFAKVHAFEINGELTKELAAYNPGNIEIHPEGLSSQEGTAVLYIPVWKGVPLTGWASLAPGNCPDTNEHVEKSVRICCLDMFQIAPVSFMKIDVEGHEVEVLKGAVRTIESSRPTVLMEIKEKNLNEVSSFFAERNYQKKRLQDFINKDGSEENYIFVPK